MKDKMKKLLESVILKEADFKSDDGISTVPAPEFSGALPATTLPQAGEGKSKDAKNADFKGKKKDEPKKLKEEEEEAAAVETVEVVAEAPSDEVPADVEVVAEDTHDQLLDQLNNTTAKISYYEKNYNKDGGDKPAELTALYKKRDEIKKQMRRMKTTGPKNLQNSYEVDKSLVDVSEDIAAIFSSDDELTEEFKSKVTTIFETAVIAKANEVIAKVVAEANENIEKQFAELDEDFDALHLSLVEAAEASYEAKTVEMTEKMEALTDKAITEWKETNAVAIHSAAKVEIAESFMTGLKDLFEVHNIEIPETKIDVTEALLAEVESLKEKLDSEIEKNLSLQEEISDKRKNDLTVAVSEGLTDVEKGKFQALAENIDYSSEEDYTSKLKQIKESYFAKKPEKVVTPIEEADAGIELTEEVVKIDPLMEAILKAGKKFGKK